MRTIIAGSRHIHDPHWLHVALRNCPWSREITSVVCGGAPGVDLLGDQWAKTMGLPVEYFLVAKAGALPRVSLLNISYGAGHGHENVTIASDWEWDGAAAGPIRNRAMADHADALIALPLKGDRKGTDSMLREAYRRNLRVFEMEVADD